MHDGCSVQRQDGRDCANWMRKAERGHDTNVRYCLCESCLRCVVPLFCSVTQRELWKLRPRSDFGMAWVCLVTLRYGTRRRRHSSDTPMELVLLYLMLVHILQYYLVVVPLVIGKPILAVAAVKIHCRNRNNRTIRTLNAYGAFQAEFRGRLQGLQKTRPQKKTLYQNCKDQCAPVERRAHGAADPLSRVEGYISYFHGGD